ncbi:MAG: zinc-binding alcohol dehydrogenase family protein [Oceanospirillaceae bacterium]|nr:zinc-binding alcohol dehydrogenase family protein [Oceanospirillaceae bacterium]
MKSVVCSEPGSLLIQDVARPVDKPGQVIVKIKRIGICGTDIHAFGGNQPFFQYPRVLGHELSGEIESVGEGVQLSPGQDVYIVPYMSCGNCIACHRGKTNCCTDIQVLGVHVDGGMCEYLQVPEQYVITTKGMDLDQLAVVECLAIGAHAVRRAKLAAGSTVLVVGAGPIGMGIMQFAKEAGAKVFVMDMNQERLAFCKEKLGADQIIQVGPQAREQIATLTDGDFIDTVFDATGNPKAMEAGFQLVAHGGSYVLVSVVKADISFSDPEFHKREMTLLGSRNATREDFEHVVNCLDKGSVKANVMITHRGKLLDLPKLLPSWCKAESGVIKAVVEV